MKALVTGATGFVGSHLVDALVAAGWEVTALHRKTSQLCWVENKPIRLVEGDVRDANSLISAVKEQDVIFHAAGAIRARNYREFEDTNHGGAGNLMKMVMKHNPNVTKVIYISSLAAGGPTTPDHPLTEEDPSRPFTAYGKTKYAGEQAILSSSDQLNVLAIRPPIVYGPRDKGVLQFFQMVAKHLRINVGFSNRYATVVHVSDLVNALLLTATNQTKSGTFYYIDDGVPIRTWFELQNEIVNTLGTWAIKVRIPLTPLFLTAAILHTVQQFTRKRYWISLTKYRQLAQQAWLCDGCRIRSELGYEPKASLEEGIRQTAEWYKEMGWI